MSSFQAGGEGALAVFMWPVYVGMCQGEPGPDCGTEPYYNPEYRRGQITWTMQPNNGPIVGEADIHVPAGLYTHLTYHYGPGIWPAGPQLMGARQLEYPVGLTAGTIRIAPINEGDWINMPRCNGALIG